MPMRPAPQLCARINMSPGRTSQEGSVEEHHPMRCCQAGANKELEFSVILGGQEPG